jgi:hypothetical protein
MIAKISSINTLYGALSYNQNNVDKEQAKVIFCNKMIEPRDGNFNIHSCLQSFEPYLPANRKTEKPVFHPDPNDKLSDETVVGNSTFEKIFAYIIIIFSGLKVRCSL